MDYKTRVLKTIAGEQVDKVPKGELLIDPEFMAEYYGQTGQVSFENQVKFLEDFNMDLISLFPRFELTKAELTNPEELALVNVATEDVAKWARETDYFVFGVVGGGFQPATFYYDFMEILKLTHSNQELAGRIFRRFAQLNTEIALKALEAGAHGIIIGDDIAYNKGTYFSPQVMREILFPHLQSMVTGIKKTGAPVFFHADGNLNRVLGDLVQLGFDGIHSLQPSAGMDIGEVKQEYGDKVCLMGNMDLDRLIPLGSLEEIEQAVKDTMAAAKVNGRYIFGTCGAISNGLPLDKIVALYEAADKYGRYQ